jgi:hypothetical protein rflaF_11474
MNEERLNEQTDREDQGQDISAREARRQELIGMFNPNRLKVVRKELFPSPRDPALTIRDGNISFNAACIKSLEDVVYINLYIDEELGLFSISGCDENDKQALRWCVAKDGKRKSRRMRCPEFTDYLYNLMGWDKKCRYKVLGYLIPFEGSLFFVFDLNVKQTFNEKPKKGEEPVDENGEPIQVDTRKGYFSEDILHTFGVPMDQHKAETEVTEMDGFVNIAMLTGPAKAGSAGETVKEAPDQEHQKNHVGTQRYPGQGEEKGQWEATGGSALF